MFKLFSGVAPVPVRTEPTALLKLVAGEFAVDVARIWPEPHTDFLTAATARRHLVCLSLALGHDVAIVAGVVLRGRLREAIPHAFDTAPAGLERALGRLGETAWTACGYRRLTRLLDDPRAAKLLRHADTIDREAFARLDRLPEPMGRALQVAQLITDDAAVAVNEAAAAIARRSGDDEARSAAQRWAAVESEAALFDAVREDLYPELPAPPFKGTATLRPLATKAAMRDAARRFNNCLAGRIVHAVAGFSAYYEWLYGPGAIVEISRDAVFGWRLEEAKGPNNDVLDADARAALAAELAILGVSVGRSGWQLERALRPDVGRDWRLPSVAEDLVEVFGA